MAAASQFMFARKELIELMIKSVGVHEGLWRLDANFRTSGSNFGPPDDLNPGVSVVIQSLGIQLVTPDKNLPESMTVDAAVVNPVQITRAETDTKKRKHH